MRDRHDPLPRRRPGRAPARRAAAHGADGGGGPRAGHRRGGHAPVRHVGGPADRLAPALPRPDRRAAVRGPPGADLRDPRARGAGRPRQGDPRDQRHAGAPAAAAGAVGQLALLARGPDRAAVQPHADLPRLPARWDPARATTTSRTGRAGSSSWWSCKVDRRLHLPLVRRPAPPQVRHGRDPGDGLPDPARAHARPGRAGAGDGQGAGRALRLGPAALALPLRDARREQVAGRPPRPGGRAGGPARARARAHASSWRAGWSTACAGTPRTWARPSELAAIDDLLDNGNGARRQIVVFEANHDLREVVGEIVAATDPSHAAAD